MKKAATAFPLGVVVTGRTEYLFFRVKKGKTYKTQILTSAPKKLSFDIFADSLTLGDEDSQILSDFRFGKLRNGYYFLTYKAFGEGKVQLKGALSRDLINWKSTGEIPFCQGEIGALLSLHRWKGNYLFYYGEKNINLLVSPDLSEWEIEKKPLLQPRDGFFDSGSLTLIRPLLIKEGILVPYWVKEQLVIGASLFNKNDPKELFWRSETPVWDTTEQVFPIGATAYRKDIIFYFATEVGEIKEVVIPLDRLRGRKPRSSFYFKRWELVLEKYDNNPVITPRSELSWESQATFNAAAFYEDDKVHLVYRAIGDSNISVLGYATSKDGVHIDERLDEPIYVPSQPFEYSGQRPSRKAHHFISGGGWGGCEDPRITKINDRYYMTYVAFDGFNPPRVALTSIAAEDFHNRNWNWMTPVLISQPGVVDKNAIIFPEKVNGKYVIFHRIFPNILVDFIDDLSFDGSRFLKGEYMIKPRSAYWDSRKVGAGPPPIKTEKGWLLIYHAVDDRDPGKYKIGAMILDLNNPTRVLFRTNKPILEPIDWYENEGYKKGVVYPCGATVIKKRLFVYYGGADTVICVASKDLDELLDQIEYSNATPFETVINPRQIFAYHG